MQEEQQQQKQEEQQPDQENKENQEEPKNQEEMEQKQEQNQEAPQETQGRQGYQPIDENRINWQELEERWGVKRDELEKVRRPSEDAQLRQIRLGEGHAQFRRRGI